MSVRVVSFGEMDLAGHTAVIQGSNRVKLHGVSVDMVTRTSRWPRIGAVGRKDASLPIGITLENNVGTERSALFRAFAPESDKHDLTITGGTPGVPRFVSALCKSLDAVIGSANTMFIATMVIDDDVRWRATTASTDSWSITADGQQKTLTNTGDDEAYPIIRITPTSAQSAGFSVRRFISVVWNSTNSVFNYPIMLLDGVAVTGAQVDLDDLRVYVDGIEVDRWASGSDAAADCWILLDFAGRIGMTLKTDIGSGDTVEILDVNEDVTFMSVTGILKINSEVFTYTGRNITLRRFTGVSRAQKGSSAGAHTAGDYVLWVQHNVELLYGNAALSAPTVDDRYEPVIDMLASTNSNWEWDQLFGDDAGLRPGRWAFSRLQGLDSDAYTDTHGASVDPWEVIGAHLYPPEPVEGESASNTRQEIIYSYASPVPIYSADTPEALPFEKKLRDITAGIWSHCAFTLSSNAVLAGHWSNYWDITKPTVDDTWQTQAGPPVPLGGTGLRYYYVGFRFLISTEASGSIPEGEANDAHVEVDHVRVTFYSVFVPEVTVYDASGNYQLDMLLHNNTTGDSIRIMLQMEEDETIEIDTAQKIVTYLFDDSIQAQAVEPTEPRVNWLPLQVEENVLEIEDATVQGMTITFEWRRRYFY